LRKEKRQRDRDRGEREREEEGYRLLAEELLAFVEDERAIRFVNRERKWET
jgi:hypothetical protein